MHAPDDAELGERLRAGDPDALRELYRRFAGAVFTVARAYVHDRGRAEEVVQQTFLNAWRAGGTLHAGSRLSPWLYQIARRCALDAVRAEARRRRRPVPLASGQPNDPATVVEQTWEAFEVRRAIDALPPAERETARLAHVEGLTQREIAERLGVPVGTVKSRLGRAHRHLTEALAHVAPTNRSDVPAVLQEEG